MLLIDLMAVAVCAEITAHAGAGWLPGALIYGGASLVGFEQGRRAGRW